MLSFPLWRHRNALRPRQNGRHFADDIFKCFFLNENVSIPIKISLKFVPKGPINNNPALVQIMAWRRSSDKPLSEPMMVSLLTHICVTRPQWVNSFWLCDVIWHHRSGSNLDQAMACYLAAPSHYLNQHHLHISGVLRHSAVSNFTASESNIMYEFNEYHTLKRYCHISQGPMGWCLLH